MVYTDFSIAAICHPHMVAMIYVQCALLHYERSEVQVSLQALSWQPLWYTALAWLQQCLGQLNFSWRGKWVSVFGLDNNNYWCYDHRISTATMVVGYHWSNTVTVVFYSVLGSLSWYGFPKSCPSLFWQKWGPYLYSRSVGQTAGVTCVTAARQSRYQMARRHPAICAVVQPSNW